MLKRISLVSLCVLFSCHRSEEPMSEIFSRFNGSIAGNGGDVLVCDAQPSVEMFDAYEARNLRGLVPSLGAEDASVETKIQMALERSYKTRDLVRYKFLLDAAIGFLTPHQTTF